MIARPGFDQPPGSESAPSEVDHENEREHDATLGALAREIAFRLEGCRSLGWQVPLRPRAAAGDPLATERARRRALLHEIDREVRACRECRLCESRRQTVFGVGDPCAALLFVGEGPGHDEDRLGEPFVGKAGKLLDRMIAAMGLRRSEVYIANIVKCRPPGNRAPEPPEALSCLPYLRRQIEVVRPRVICALGNTPLRFLLGSGEGITRARGKELSWEGIPAIPTFHPAYLLRNPEDKRLAWEDLQKVMEILGLPAPGR